MSDSDIMLIGSIIAIYVIGAFITWVVLMLIAYFDIDAFNKYVGADMQSRSISETVMFWPVALMIVVIYNVFRIPWLIHSAIENIQNKIVDKGVQRKRFLQERNYKHTHKQGL